MRQDEVDLVNIIGTWLENNPKYNHHFVIISKPVSTNPLSWIACKCRRPYEYPPALPPTPKLDFIIDDTDIEVYGMAGTPQGQIWELLLATSPNFFDKLEYYLDMSH